MTEGATGLLAGIRVLDLSCYVAGPYGSQLLSDLGARVTKVEPPGGDPLRGLPPFVNGTSTYFATYNHNKRSIVLDLNDQRGRDILLSLAAKADVFYHNYRPNYVDRARLDYESILSVNPSVVYCALSGYGRGPESHRRASDVAVQAISGAMSITGHYGEQPIPSGIPFADLNGGAVAALSVVAALVRRQRTGEPAHLDISMRDSVSRHSWDTGPRSP